MSDSRRIDQILTAHINLYVEQIVQRTLQIAKRPNSYDASEHAGAAKLLDDLLESYCDDAAELDAILHRKRITRIPTTNELRHAMGREPIAELEDEATNLEWKLNVELIENLRVAEAAVASLRERAETAERERDEWERKSKNNGLAAAIAMQRMKELENKLADARAEIASRSRTPSEDTSKGEQG